MAGHFRQRPVVVLSIHSNDLIEVSILQIRVRDAVVEPVAVSPAKPARGFGSQREQITVCLARGSSAVT